MACCAILQLPRIAIHGYRWSGRPHTTASETKELHANRRVDKHRAPTGLPSSHERWRSWRLLYPSWPAVKGYRWCADHNEGSADDSCLIASEHILSPSVTEATTLKVIPPCHRFIHIPERPQIRWWTAGGGCDHGMVFESVAEQDIGVVQMVDGCIV
jgi:hypothetical protein